MPSRELTTLVFNSLVPDSVNGSLFTINVEKNTIRFHGVPLCRCPGAESLQGKNVKLQLMYSRLSPTAEPLFEDCLVDVILSGPQFVQGQLEDGAIRQDRIFLCEIPAIDLATKYVASQYQEVFSWAVRYEPFMNFQFELQVDKALTETFGDSLFVIRVLY